MSKLKECPFCGGEVTIFNVGIDWHRVSANHSDECILIDTDFDYPQTEESKSELIEDWNSRTSTQNSKIEKLIDCYYEYINSDDSDVDECIVIYDVIIDLKKLIGVSE